MRVRGEGNKPLYDPPTRSIEKHPTNMARLSGGNGLVPNADQFRPSATSREPSALKANALLAQLMSERCSPDPIL
jgi:hypothetical protein